MKQESLFYAQAGLQACQKRPRKLSFIKPIVVLVFAGVISIPVKTYSQGSGGAEANTRQAIEQSQVIITGKITDSSTGERMPGVNVLIEGTSTGTVTDIYVL